MSAIYYLSRGGAPEGPFEEARLLDMIQRGELSEGGVCAVGEQAWSALHSVPVFAQALATRGGPSLAQAQPEPSAALAGGSAVAAQPPHPPSPTIPERLADRRATSTGKSRRGLLFAALGALLLVLIAAAAGAAYLMFFSSGGARNIASSMPPDCELMIEVPSVHQLLAEMHQMQHLDTSLRDDQQILNGAAASIAKAFDLSTAHALSLLASAETFGIAGRRLASTPELVLALGFKSGSPVEKWLKSPRFSLLGSVGTTGKRYQLTQKQSTPSASPDVLQSSLGQAQVAAVGQGALVWFPRERLLTLGDDQLVRDLAQVIETNSPAIRDSSAYRAASADFDGNARLTVFVDPKLFAGFTAPRARAWLDAYFEPTTPITGSLQIKPVGLLTHFQARAQGHALESVASDAAPQALALGARLPEETLCYLDFSTSPTLSGVDAQRLLFEQLGALNPDARTQAEQGLHRMESLLGVSASRLLEGIGAQGVVGLSAAPDLSLAALSTGPEAAGHFNLTWLLELKDATEFKQLSAKLTQKLLPSFHELTVTSDGAGGFSIAPRLPSSNYGLRFKFVDKYLFVSAGNNALAARSEAAFVAGDRTLKDDAAHQAALAALPAAQQLLLWVDSGRLSGTLLANPLVKAQLAGFGVSLEHVKLTGPERLVSALSVRHEVQNGVRLYQLDTLNFQALAPLGAAGALFGG